MMVMMMMMWFSSESIQVNALSEITIFSFNRLSDPLFKSRTLIRRYVT